MSEEMVRVLTDPKNDVYETVPVSQVPPGYVRVHIRDRGEFYIDAAVLSPTPEYQHPPFAPDVCAELEKQHEALVRAGWEKTLDEWFDGFRYDRTPWREMAYWECVVAAVNRFTAHLPGDDEASASERRDVLGLVSNVAGDPSRVESHARSGGEFGPVGSLPGERVTAIINWLLSDEAVAVRRRASCRTAMARPQFGTCGGSALRPRPTSTGCALLRLSWRRTVSGGRISSRPNPSLPNRTTTGGIASTG